LNGERWRSILEFPKYEISDRGNIYNTKTRQMMRTSRTNFGHAKITLTDYDGQRYTRSVPLLVASAFVAPPNYLSDYLVMLDGDLTNVKASNLAWRPRGFAWEYTRQLKLPQPNHYSNLPVRNLKTGVEYESVIEAGVNEGLLFDDIWRSTYTRNEIYPHGSIFEIIKRV
jgi:NUMOD4 motif